MPALPPSGTVFRMTHLYRPQRRRKPSNAQAPATATGSALAHAQKKRRQRRKANEQRMDPVFVIPAIPLRPSANHAPPPHRPVEAHVLTADCPGVEPDFIPFGPADDYEYFVPRVKQKKAPSPPSAQKEREYAKWNELLPKLVDPILRYTAASFGTASGTAMTGSDHCESGDNDECLGETCASEARMHRVVAVFLRHCEVRDIKICSHSGAVIKLAEQGLFSSSPFIPGYAYSIDLLNLFLDLMRNGGNSVESLAASLHEQHRANGYVLRNRKGLPIQEGFRRTLGHAIQWYDQVRARQEIAVQERISQARVAVLYPPAADSTSGGTPTVTISPPATPRRRVPFPTVEDVPDEMDIRPDGDGAAMEPVTPPSPLPTRPAWHPPPTPPPQGSPQSVRNLADAIAGAARHWIRVAAKYGLSPQGRRHIDPYLVRKCPRCFAAAKTGRPLSECDFHFAMDACFGHRHNVSAGTSPHIAYTMQSFVPKDFVDAVGAAHDECRQGRPRKYESAVPPAAVAACESSHTAADGSRVKAGGEKHDDRAMGALVCRHDVPLFVCNIDTPGEQLKYALALLIWASLHLPDDSTILALYDIGCVAHKTVQSYDVLSELLESRVAFATSAMHAYAHQWECQIVYSPRLNPSYGLSDGEGCERLWSRIRKLISNLHSAGRQMRLITLDRHVQFVADAVRDESGKWLRDKWDALKKREFEARQEILLAGHSAEFLRQQWASQRDAQLEVRRMSAPRLRKELEAVMVLQDQIETVEEAIVSAQSAIDKSEAPSIESREHLAELRATLVQLTRQAEALYASLNVEQAFPAIQWSPSGGSPPDR